MRIVKKSVFAICIALFISGAANAKEGINFQQLSLKEGLEKAKKENKKVFIDIYATWCRPCKDLSANVFTDRLLGSFMNEHFVSLKLDGEKGDGLQLMEDFDLDAYPTMLFLSPKKEVLKKIVGGVSVETLKKGGNDVVFPEKTAIYQLEKKYKAGNRDRLFLISYILELQEEDRSTEAIVDEFLKKDPNLNLSIKGDFLVFSLGISDMKNKHMIDFLDQAKKYSELHGDMAESKMKMILTDLVDRAVEEKNSKLIKMEAGIMYKSYRDIFGEHSFEEAKLIEILVNMYNDKVE